MEELLELNGVPDAWKPLLLPALEVLEKPYREWLMSGEGYIPVRERLLAAFTTMEPHEVRYILFGQDPYPRAESAVGYAFIDGRVKEIFAPGGLSREVNRATSLRNFIKTALVADGKLQMGETSQAAIASLDKSGMIATMEELRMNFENAGVLLLNTALVFSAKEESKLHIRAWRGFISRLLEGMRSYGPSLILFGGHAGKLEKVPEVSSMDIIALEHPYNQSFVLNGKAHGLFGPMKLMKACRGS